MQFHRPLNAPCSTMEHVPWWNKPARKRCRGRAFHHGTRRIGGAFHDGTRRRFIFRDDRANGAAFPTGCAERTAGLMMDQKTYAMRHARPSGPNHPLQTALAGLAALLNRRQGPELVG